MAAQNSMLVFQNEAPGVAAAFNGLIESLTTLDGLDAKTRQLIYIGIKAAQGDAGAVIAHTPMAKAAGASREEIRDTVLLTLTVCGVRGVVNCLSPALEAYGD
ncbi:MAG: carboxymuconolactone decarboxylase family protein [Anaerolineaceae bacterium]|jgi:AhpD family alkylhydroperoxidase|nr:carboxymuconolactone decarboxylase family protein [Anaerolineaceae bacterium]